MGEFYFPTDVCLDEERRIVVTEFSSNRVQVLSREGEPISFFGNIGQEKFVLPMSCSPYKNKFFISDSEDHCIKAFDKSGAFLQKFGKQGNKDGQFNHPCGLLIRTALIIFWCVISRITEFSSFHWTVASLVKVPLIYLILVK